MPCRLYWNLACSMSIERLVVVKSPFRNQICKESFMSEAELLLALERKIRIRLHG